MYIYIYIHRRQDITNKYAESKCLINGLKYINSITQQNEQLSKLQIIGDSKVIIRTVIYTKSEQQFEFD